MNRDKDALLARLPFWESLDKDEREAARQGSAIVKYARGLSIYCGGGDCLGMVLVLSGELRAYLLSEEGREISLFRLHEGEYDILTASCVISQITFDTHMSTESDSELLVLRAGVFAELTERNIHVRCFVHELATERFSEVMWTMQQILFMGFDKRLAVFLYDEYARTGQTEIRMTHEQIAKNTGSAREVVSRMLRRFADDGLVEFRRGLIAISDLPALRRLAM